MTDIEIDKALALAIGWEPEQIWNRETYLLLPMRFDGFEHWQRFSHRDWNVIGPIAARYRLEVNFRNNIAFLPDVVRGTWADTPQKAIALAVIGAKK